MRIIAGSLGGRLFQSPQGHRTHPMSDKVRGALFNILGDISGLSVLDPFAGSGALSFEALSRGARTATAIDNDRNAQRAISENMAKLGLEDRCQLVKASAKSWLTTDDMRFDLVVLDPPYDKLHVDLLQRLAERVNSRGTVVLSWPGGEHPPKLLGTPPQANKQYGDASLHIYKRER